MDLIKIRGAVGGISSLNLDIAWLASYIPLMRAQYGADDEDVTVICNMLKTSKAQVIHSSSKKKGNGRH